MGGGAGGGGGVCVRQQRTKPVISAYPRGPTHVTPGYTGVSEGALRSMGHGRVNDIVLLKNHITGCYS